MLDAGAEDGSELGVVEEQGTATADIEGLRRGLGSKAGIWRDSKRGRLRPELVGGASSKAATGVSGGGARRGGRRWLDSGGAGLMQGSGARAPWQGMTTALRRGAPWEARAWPRLKRPVPVRIEPMRGGRAASSCLEQRKRGREVRGGRQINSRRRRRVAMLIS